MPNHCIPLAIIQVLDNTETKTCIIGPLYTYTHSLRGKTYSRGPFSHWKTLETGEVRGHNFRFIHNLLHQAYLFILISLFFSFDSIYKPLSLS